MTAFKFLSCVLCGWKYEVNSLLWHLMENKCLHFTLGNRAAWTGYWLISAEAGWSRRAAQTFFFAVH